MLRTRFQTTVLSFILWTQSFGSRRHVVSSTLSNVKDRGKKFPKSRLLNRSKAVSDTVTKNGVQFFCMKTDSTLRKTINFSRQETTSLFFLPCSSAIRQGE